MFANQKHVGPWERAFTHWGYWQNAGLIFRWRVFLFSWNLPGEFVLNEWPFPHRSSCFHHIHRSPSPHSLIHSTFTLKWYLFLIDGRLLSSETRTAFLWLKWGCLSVVGGRESIIIFPVKTHGRGSWRYQWSRLTQSRSRTTTVTKAGRRVEFVSSLVNLLLAWCFLTLRFDGRWLRFKMSDREIQQGKQLNYTEEKMLTGGERRRTSLFGWNEAA